MTDSAPLEANPSPPKPLSGITVVEAGTYFSAPFASMMLAELGAEIVKVEPPGGDPFRRYNYRYGGVSAAWVNVNHGKKSVVLDLKTDEDKTTLASILRGADVFVQNWRPGVAESLGLDRQTLEREYSRLIRLRISGFGEEGPLSSIPVFDGLLQAASGFCSREAGTDGVPRLTRSFVADKVTALFATQAVLGALLQRHATGRGCDLDLAMLDAMSYFNFPDLAQDRVFLPPAPSVDLPPTRSALLRTRDGYILVAPVTGRHIKGSLEAVGHPEWKQDLKAIESSSALLDELLGRLESVTSGWTTTECEEVFRQWDVPAIAVKTFDEHVADEQTILNEIYSTSTSTFGPVRRVRYPVMIDMEKLPLIDSAPPMGNPRGGGDDFTDVGEAT